MPEDRDNDNVKGVDMHGVTPESVQRELMDAGFQVERTEKGSRRASAAPDPRTTPESGGTF